MPLTEDHTLFSPPVKYIEQASLYGERLLLGPGSWELQVKGEEGFFLGVIKLAKID